MYQLQLDNCSIHIGNIREPLQSLLDSGGYAKIALLADENTRRACLPFLADILPNLLPVIEIPSGEQHKTIATCQHIWSEMMRIGLDRRSLLLNLGGGVIGDMGGFCAATYLRGIDFVQIPTTLLAQVDASIGGKLGVDFNFVKNAVGVFQNPRAVFVEPAFLATLPEREILSGFAEIIKHALIADDEFWLLLKQVVENEILTKAPEKNFWLPLLKRSLEIKHSVVEADPLEKGWRKALNFGHTVGHAIESFYLQTTSPLLHGEAVALGMICESRLSHNLAGLPSQDLENITAFIRRLYPLNPLTVNDFGAIVALMYKDKKNEKGRINCTLIGPLGQAQTDWFCTEEVLLESLFYAVK
jgi:3-dehydroquinate synthase